jgi:GNAT superfamily N-acetyltransferase
MVTATQAAEPAISYDIRPYARSDEGRVLDLMRLSLGETDTLKRTAEMWRWKHESSTFGNSYVLVADGSDGNLLGLRAFMRWRFIYQGAPVEAVRAVDTSTHPGYRRLGVFSRLTKTALEQVTAAGAGMVFNTPNDKSLPGYLKMGWQVVGPVKPLVRVTNRPAFAAGIVRGRLLKRESRPRAQEEFFKKGLPESVSALIASGRLDSLIAADARLWADYLHTDRSAAHLAWRYGSHPTVPYRYALVESNGEVDACAIYRTNTRAGMKEVVLSEILLRRDDTALVRELTDGLVRQLRADYLIAYYPEGAGTRTALQSNGFRQLPIAGMTLVTRLLQAPRPELMDLKRWGVSLGDLEFF